MPPSPAESNPRAANAESSSSGTPGPWLERLQGGLDRLLVLNVFLVMAGALWFGLGVILHLRGMDHTLEAFQGLWPLLFQPAIGVLMLGALLSGGLGWWKRREQR